MSTLRDVVAVIHGSAARGAQQPRDVDVAWYAPRDVAGFARAVVETEVRSLAAQWAADHGLADVPLDIHELPRAQLGYPEGMAPSHAYLLGRGGVDFAPVRHLTSRIRLGAMDPVRAARWVDADILAESADVYLGLTLASDADPLRGPDNWYHGFGAASTVAALQHLAPGFLAELRAQGLGELAALLECVASIARRGADALDRAAENLAQTDVLPRPHCDRRIVIRRSAAGELWCAPNHGQRTRLQRVGWLLSGDYRAGDDAGSPGAG